MTSSHTDNAQHLTFVVADEVFSIPILRVREILEYHRPTRVPTMPACILGVINVRGVVLPVVGLAQKLGLEGNLPGRRSCIVVVEPRWADESTTLGIVVDEVVDVVDLASSDIEPPPPFGARVRLDFLQGIAKLGSEGARKLALLLDLDRVLSLDELLAVEQLASVPPKEIFIDVEEPSGAR